MSETIKPSWWAKWFLGHTWRLSFSDPASGKCILDTTQTIEFHVFNIRAVELNRGIIWSSLTIRTHEKTYQLSGLSAGKALAGQNLCLEILNKHIETIVGQHEEQLELIDCTIRDLVSNGEQYLAKNDLAETVSKLGTAAARALAHPLLDLERLSPDIGQKLKISLEFLLDPSARETYNTRFLADELIRFNDFFDNFGGSPLTDEQREACIRLEDANLLVAAAGSGKTATMVAKVAYLLQKKLYQPEEILVLAFNKDAAQELEQRIAKELAVPIANLGCHVSTFHALGRQIISKATGSPPQLASWVEHSKGESRLFDTLIAEISATDPEFRKGWAELLIYFEKADLLIDSFSAAIDYQRYIADIQYRKSADTDDTFTVGNERLNAHYKGSHPTVMTLVPDLYVRSLQEQRIVNWLWMHSVSFEYEKQLTVTGKDGKPVIIRPDFYYPDAESYHEHFAVHASGKSPFKGYAEVAKLKRRAYKAAKIDYFETTLSDVSGDRLFEVLERELTKRGVQLTPRSQQEIDAAFGRLNHAVRRYHLLIGVCVKHVRSGNLSRAMLERRAEDLTHTQRARRFISVLWKLVEAYNQKLAQTAKIDFESMIGDAISLVEDGEYVPPYKLILVDEFQDISEPRAQLIKALKSQVQFSKVFAVGDDWQSIYRFAGSDVTIFTGFDNHFGDSWQGKLQRTFRSNENIAKAAAKFVQKNPDQVRKEVTSAKEALPRSIRVIPILGTQDNMSFEQACHELLDRINQSIATKGLGKRSLKVLARYNFILPRNSNSLQRTHLQVETQTFHRAKGLEADYTILLDVSEGIYGVPSRIEDDELINLVIPQPETFPYAEERRLFYVALTRASSAAFVLYQSGKKSRFIEELESYPGDALKHETITGDTVPHCPQCQHGIVVERRSRKTGLSFWACDGYPACTYIEKSPPCPECKRGILKMRKNSKTGKPFLGCSRYPTCKYVHP